MDKLSTAAAGDFHLAVANFRGPQSEAPKASVTIQDTTTSSSWLCVWPENVLAQGKKRQ